MLQSKMYIRQHSSLEKDFYRCTNVKTRRTLAAAAARRTKNLSHAQQSTTKTVVVVLNFYGLHSYYVQQGYINSMLISIGS